MIRARGFTLVEILIVVVLLGVIAAIVVPSIGNCGNSARSSVLAPNLSMLRRFVLVYASHHLEVAPGYTAGLGSAVDADMFAAQALLSSDAEGNTATPGTPGYRYGPYLSNIPRNPFNNLNTIRMLADGQDFPDSPDNNHGWIYKAETGEIRPDNTGADDSGRPYYAY